MSELYRNKYKITSNRLQRYDYGSEGAYFITICTAIHIIEFGNVVSGEMILNEFGKIVETEILQTPILRKNVFLGEFCIMPNHIHFIIFINVSGFTPELNNRLLQHSDYKNKFGAQINNLSSIIRGFKSSCTSKIIKAGNRSFAWQRNFYDVIIRNEWQFKNVENYIRNNPQKWDNDKFYRTAP